MKTYRSIYLLFTALLISPATSQSATIDFEKSIRPILNKYCVDCHGEKKQKGKVRFDNITHDLINGHDAARAAETWHDALDNIQIGEMPPEDELQPSAKERQLLTQWINTALKQAAEAHKKARMAGTDSPHVIRRLTRYEYNNTLRDLLGLDYNYAENLPPEPKSKDGFKNNGESLGLSPIQMDYYLKAARKALGKVIVTGDKPNLITHEGSKSADARKPYRPAKSGKVNPGELFTTNSKQFPRQGLVKVTVEAKAVVPQGSGHPRLQVLLGHRPDTGFTMEPIGAADLKPTDGFQQISFTGLIENFPLPGHNPKFPGLIIGVANPYEGIAHPPAPKKPKKQKKQKKQPQKTQKKKPDPKNKKQQAKQAPQKKQPVKQPQKNQKNQKNQKRKRKGNKTVADAGESIGVFASPLLNVSAVTTSSAPPVPQVPHIMVKSIRFEGPIYDQWPPKAHQDIMLGYAKGKPEASYAKRIITEFMKRAYRRPVSDLDTEPVIHFYQDIRPEMPSFESAIQEALAMILVSPEFLFLAEPVKGKPKSNQLSAHETASRLSYFLASSMPDDKLRMAADKGVLFRKDELKKQAARLLNSQQADEFIRHFTTQWLSLDGIDRVAINPEYYPKFKDELKPQMREETIQFVREIIRGNHSALNLIDSDFLMLNGPLTKHYGIDAKDPPKGLDFERVAIKPEDRRGGLLSQAGILLLNSTGEDSHPIRRAVWLRDRLLNDPPADPPPDVPDLDSENPDFAALPLKRQLELHREKAACNDCHARIDPWGIPFEHFDAIGKWRDEVNRVVPRKRGFVKAEVVDSATLPTGHKIEGLDNLKKYMLSHQKDKFARGLVSRLLTYALGRSLTLADRSEVERLTASFAENDYRIKQLILEIADSPTFRSR